MRAMPLVFAVVYALAATAPSEAGPGSRCPPPPPPRRPPCATSGRATPVAALFLRFGNEKSARFREIVRALERSNVIVYVEVRQESAHPVGGGLTFIGEANGVRWVRAMVDSGTPSHLRTCQDIVRLTSILGHELQHAWRPRRPRRCRTSAGSSATSARSGSTGSRRVLDTLAARQTGKQVADELRGMARPRGGRGVGRELRRARIRAGPSHRRTRPGARAAPG